MIIDFHTHTFPDKMAEKTIKNLSAISQSKNHSDGTATELINQLADAGVSYGVTLPVATNTAQVEKLNDLAIKAEAGLEWPLKEMTEGQAVLIPFGAMHPEYENPKAQLKLLKEAGVRGIKVHPAYQNVEFDDIRFLRIIAAASELDMVVVTHAGVDIGIYDKDYASTTAILKVVKEVAPPKLVLAHMGGWSCWDRVKSDLAGAPLYFDTAFSLGKIDWNQEGIKHNVIESNLSPLEFSQLVKAHGADKILFATDSPWASIKEYVTFIKTAPLLTDEEKSNILGLNAMRLL